MTSAVTSYQLAFISSVHVLLHCDQAEREEVDEPPPPPTEGSDSRGVWGKKITFRRAVNTIVTGQRIHNEITVGAVLNMFSFFRFHRVTSCVQLHTVLFFKIYAVEIGHQFRARGIIRIGQDYISSEYEQVPTGAF